MGICPPPQAVPDDSASRKAAIHREVALQGVAPEDVQKPRIQEGEKPRSRESPANNPGRER